MSSRVWIGLLCALWIGAFAYDQHVGSSAAKKERDYPRPEYVQYPKLNDQQLMYLARHVARETETRSGSLGVIEPGKKGLIVIKDNQDLRVMKAVVQALRERGADADYIHTSRLMEMYGYPKALARVLALDPIAEPEKQFVVQGIFHYEYKRSYFSEAAWAQLPEMANEQEEEMRRLRLKNELLKKYVDSHPEYDYVFVEWTGSDFQHRELTRLLGRKYQLGWRFINPARLLEEGQIPAEVWRVVEQKVLELVPFIRHVHVTDPEGTDLEFSVTAEDASYWRMGAYLEDYMMMYPMQATKGLYNNFKIKHQVVPDSNGVLAGTQGHFMIVVPHMKVTVEHGMAVRIEGGGIQGTMLNDLRERYKDYRIPHMPGPGWTHLFHIEMPVNPKDGNRYLEWGFGTEVSIPEAVEYEIKNNVPRYHDFHLRNLFPTYEATVTGGKKIKLVEKGYLSALSDPEVRAIASKYGDPDEILKPEGAVPIPGINAPGDYWKDYALAPRDFWLKERRLVADGRSPFIIRILPSKLRDLAGPQQASNSPASRKGISAVSSALGSQ